ncbi:MAG: acetolactate decarboxylase [Flavobacteriales bacterium]|nr:MAG: acetolactate decarboxylase [Flavobacteriales bacterium]
MRRIAPLAVAVFLGFPGSAQVIATGALKRTMWDGQCSGLIAMDTLGLPGVYGMGPLEHMRGEITLVDGRCHVARVDGDSLVVQVDSTVKAPFFVHARVARWEDVKLPREVADDRHLDAYLDQRSGDEPFFFRLAGRFDAVDLHVWDLPADSSFRGPAEGARYKRQFSFKDIEGEVLAVFSRHHRTVFTHHDSFIHLHFLGTDGRTMGHVDGLRFIPGRAGLQVGRP